MTAALVISTLFEPMFVLCAASILAGVRSGLSGSVFAAYVVYIFAFAVIIAIVRTHAARKSKTNWDLSDHGKRIKPLGYLTAIIGVNVFFISRFGNGQLTTYHALWFIWALGYLLITLRTKISGHMSAFVFAAALLYRMYGQIVLPLAVVIPFLAWSRIRLGRHTVPEVLGGTLHATATFAVLLGVALW